MKIDVFTDGSGTTGNKAAGYGWVLVIDGKLHAEGNGHLDQGTNNDAEMQAAIAGLAACLKLVNEIQTNPRNANRVFDVTLCSDSQITLGWADGTYKFKQESKYQRFEILKELMKRLDAKTRWVKGHSGDLNNERSDVLANLGRHRLGPNDYLPSKKPRSASKGIKTKRSEITVEFNGVPHLINFASLTVTPLIK